MHFSTILLLLPLALAAPALVRRAGTGCSNAPSSFQINGFGVFTASPGPSSYSHISFEVIGSASNVSTQCGRSLPPGSGRSAADPDHYYSCSNANVTYLWDGSHLAVTEIFSCNGVLETAFSNSSISTYCYPESAPVPGAPGTNCQTPTGQISIPVLYVI